MNQPTRYTVDDLTGVFMADGSPTPLDVSAAVRGAVAKTPVEPVLGGLVWPIWFMPAVGLVRFEEGAPGDMVATVHRLPKCQTDHTTALA